MRANEFYINVGDEKIEAFVYDGFFNARIAASSLHTHKYTEIHFTSCGECTVYTDDKTITCNEGTVTAIPQGMLHGLMPLNGDAFHLAFLVNYPIKDVMQSKVSPEFLRDLSKLIKTYREHKNFDAISNYLSFIVKDVVRSRCELSLVTNREFLITEFFANHYNEDVSLNDIASLFNLSEKQAGRLVEKYMGAQFTTVLSEYRVRAAKKILAVNPKLSLSEVAELVGYRSYSGFWKAFKKYGMLQAES